LQLFLGCALVLGLLAVLLTFDRAAWLGLAGATLALAAVGLSRKGEGSLTSSEDSLTFSPDGLSLAKTGRPPRAPRVGLFLAGLASVIALAAGATMLPGVRARFLSSFDVERNSDRVFLWSRALEIIRDHPWVGIGFGNYPRICSRYYDRIDPTFPMRTWAHNSILSLWAETGVPGIAALGYLCLRIARALLARLRAGGMLSAGALAAALSWAVVAQAHDLIYDSKVMYPLWLALALGLHPRLDREDGDDRAKAPRPLTRSQQLLNQSQ
jgi:O-antigen ligase